MAAGAGGNPLEVPSADTVREARTIIAAMRANDRGPYSQIRWFCADGTVHPPKPYACSERGGGRQHGEYSPGRARLAELGWSVGTVYAALSWDEYLDAGRRNARMRELALERYLVDTEGGWVLERAQYYRGRVQVEDEEAAGRRLLVRSLDDGEWVAANYLLARELVRTVPHHAGTDRTQTVRRLSKEIAEQDASFEKIRITIHTRPSVRDLERTGEWIAAAKRRGVSAALVKRAEELEAGLRAIHQGAGERVDAALATARGAGLAAEIGDPLAARATRPPRQRLEVGTMTLGRLRDAVLVAKAGSERLALLDLSLALESELLPLAFEVLSAPGLTRADLMQVAGPLLHAVYGSGLLSARERDAVHAEIEAQRARGDRSPTEVYLAAIDGLRRVAGWGAGAVRYTFAEPLVRYTALEPRAAGFVDDLLRSTLLLPLSELATRLLADAEAVSGRVHRLFGRSESGVLGLNPGVATGPFRVAADDETDFDRRDIVLLPSTVSELKPVAGVVSVSEGNLLSHVQLLARNLGIPNVSVAPAVAARIGSAAGEKVVLAVDTSGSVVLEAWERIPTDTRSLLPSSSALADKVAAPSPDLGRRAPLRLADLHSGLSGRVVGPKAANLGELARTFPGHVAPAVALPFGLFAQHVAGGAGSPKARLDAAFARHRAGAASDAELAAEVEAVRRAVQGLTLDASTREVLATVMAAEFGPAGSYGVFVRSDTSVEDLPGFTGAGLNLTVANVVGFDEQLATIPRVWASPYSERANAWRSLVLDRPEEVYTSVLLMKSVPADKSGVLVTTDLVTGGPGLTVACSWGIGGAVDGESAETTLLRPDGTARLVAEAKAPYRRRLSARGGVEWVPAPTGRVLTDAEIARLRRLAAEVAERLTPARDAAGRPLPWDIEFGFVDGDLQLFQIRPLIERGQQIADRLVAALAPDRPAPSPSVDLRQVPKLVSP